MMAPHIFGTLSLLMGGVGLLGLAVGYGLNRAITKVIEALPQQVMQREELVLSDAAPARSPRKSIPLLCAGLSSLVAGRYGAEWVTLWGLLLLWVLLALMFIDLETLLLPDRLTLPLLWGGLLINALGGLTDLDSAVWGAMAGYVLLWTVYWLYWWITRREGIGYGDFKLLAALGAWLGWQALPLVLLLASLSGVVAGVYWLWRGGYSRHTPIPFGPFLAAAGYGVMLWGKGGLP